MSHHENTYSRRFFLKVSGAFTLLAVIPQSVHAFYKEVKAQIFKPKETVQLQISVNGKTHTLQSDTRTTLLDLLRENLKLTGTKKGCDHGQCGACTVHVDGERVLSCLTLAVTLPGHEVTTIEGLEKDGKLHPMQEAFLEHDGFQCGYCTPGQIMSAVACVNEGHAGSVEEVKTYMSGNICRCGAYNGITNAVLKVANA